MEGRMTRMRTWMPTEDFCTATCFVVCGSHRTAAATRRKARTARQKDGPASDGKACTARRLFQTTARRLFGTGYIRSKFNRREKKVEWVWTKVRR